MPACFPAWRTAGRPAMHGDTTDSIMVQNFETGGEAMNSSGGIDVSGLSKGQLRKLRALRKSVGVEIGERAFAEWLASQAGSSTKADANAAVIVETLWPMVEQGALAIPRGGYLVKRGRGRIIVEAAKP